MRKFLVIAAFAPLAAAALATRPGAGTPVVHAATPQVFNPTGAQQIYNVPAGVTVLLIEARGGKGGNAAAIATNPNCLTGALGGVGAQVTTRLTLPPGTTQLFVNVGGNGSVTSGGFNGGGQGGPNAPTGSASRGAGGGGASDVRLVSGDPASRLVVAGAGGGAGGCGFFGVAGGAGGTGGNSGPTRAGGGGDTGGGALAGAGDSAE